MWHAGNGNGNGIGRDQQSVLRVGVSVRRICDLKLLGKVTFWNTFALSHSFKPLSWRLSRNRHREFPRQGRVSCAHTHIKAKCIALSIVWPNANAFGLQFGLFGLISGFIEYRNFRIRILTRDFREAQTVRRRGD